MIFYRHQVVKLTSYNKPAIFLGWDNGNIATKTWVLRIDRGEPEVDWFYDGNLDYYTSKTVIPGAPENSTVFYGKFKKNEPLVFVSDPVITDEEKEAFAQYLKELTEKYKNTES
jgi:hypothetical protein